MDTAEIKSVFVIVGPDEKVWSNTCALHASKARDKFCCEWLSVFKMDSVDLMHVWQIADKNGYRVLELEVQP